MHSDVAAHPNGSRVNEPLRPIDARPDALRSSETLRSSEAPRSPEVPRPPEAQRHGDVRHHDAQPGRRLIKRYSNRKLYDTHASRYVTLTQIAEMVGDGEVVKVVDNKTREDKTEFTFAQVILEQLKSSTPGIARVKLAEIIRECQQSRSGIRPLQDSAHSASASPGAGSLLDWQTHMEDQLEQLPAAEAAAWRARLRDLNARLGELKQRALQAGVGTQVRPTLE